MSRPVLLELLQSYVMLQLTFVTIMLSLRCRRLERWVKDFEDEEITGTEEETTDA